MNTNMRKGWRQWRLVTCLALLAATGFGNNATADTQEQPIIVAPTLHEFTEHVKPSSPWSVTSWSFSHTHTAGRGLFVTLNTRGAVPINSATYDGVPMTKLAEHNLTASGAAQSMALFYLEDPGSKTADVAVNFGAESTDLVAWAMEISGYDTSEPLGATATGSTGWSSSFLVDITLEQENSLVLVDFSVREKNTTDITMDSSLTRHSFLEASSDNGPSAALGSVVEASSGSKSYAGSNTSGDLTFEAAYEIKGVTAPANSTEGETSTELSAELVSTPPEIDGDLSNEYTGAPKVTLTNSWGATGEFYLVWDANALYLGGKVSADSQLAAVSGEDGALWWDDSIEIWIDTLNDGGTVLQADDYKFYVGANSAKGDAVGTGSSIDGSWDGAWSHAVKANGTVNQSGDTDTGYTVEIAIPWSTIGVSAPAVDTIMGLDIRMNDRDDAGTWLREAWVAGLNDPSKFGSVRLLGATANATEVSAWLASTPPEIDGDLSNEYTGAPKVTLTNSWGETGEFYLVWDANALYLGGKVSADSQLAAVSGEDGALWWDDSIEIWIDTLNDGGTVLQTDDYKFYVGANSAKGDAVGTGSSIDGSWDGAWSHAVKANGTVNQSGDTDTGYTVEIKIPWWTIGVTPAVDNVFGFDLRMNGRDDAGDWVRAAWVAGMNVPDEFGTLRLLGGSECVSGVVDPKLGEKCDSPTPPSDDNDNGSCPSGICPSGDSWFSGKNKYTPPSFEPAKTVVIEVSKATTNKGRNAFGSWQDSYVHKPGSKTGPYYEIPGQPGKHMLIKMKPGAEPLDLPLIVDGTGGKTPERVHFLGVHVDIPLDSNHVMKVEIGHNRASRPEDGTDWYYLHRAKSPLAVNGTKGSTTLKSITYEGVYVNSNGGTSDFIPFLRSWRNGNQGTDYFVLNSVFKHHGGVSDGFHADFVHYNSGDARDMYFENVRVIANQNFFTVCCGSQMRATMWRNFKWSNHKFIYETGDTKRSPTSNFNMRSDNNDNTFENVYGQRGCYQGLNNQSICPSGLRTTNPPDDNDIAPDGQVGINYVSPFQ